ncbi:hypothetical protein CG740_23185 [Streptomyces sp. CB01201]|uniref:hypothetical protein n=1 Tax=Streptomyces sp. CB01201 TaxID=2020324 RepID=UPI000C2770C6|nr:hypothetical protein [Streptomyces sp. CB01201]PJN00813.1 hypothetical protein CG740_23185 [Streptomyces sp. CB01201]
MSEPKYQSTRDYIAAKHAGDTETTSRIVREVGERFETRTTDGTEAAELLEATMTTRLGRKH